jgi:hypothetical protein
MGVTPPVPDHAAVAAGAVGRCAGAGVAAAVLGERGWQDQHAEQQREQQARRQQHTI